MLFGLIRNSVRCTDCAICHNETVKEGKHDEPNNFTPAIYRHRRHGGRRAFRHRATLLQPRRLRLGRENGAAPPAPDAPQAHPLAPGAIPIIDTHIHLFDNTRPVFSGYMGSPAYRALNKPSLPSMYAPLARPAGIVGAIVVESAAHSSTTTSGISRPARDNPIMVGVSGSLDPSSADFGQVSEPLSPRPALSRHPLQPLLHRGRQRQGHAQSRSGRQPEAAGPGRPRAGHRQSIHAPDAGQRAAGRRDPQPAHHHGPSAVLRSHARRPGGV